MNFLNNLFGWKKPKKEEQPPGPHPKPENKLPLETLRSMLEPYKRTAYIPITTSSERSFSAHSKFGGYPYLEGEWDWPVCPNCGSHMQLFLQLNLNEVPVQTEDALIQLFYCTNEAPPCESDCDAYSPFSTSVVCRKTEIGGPSVSIHPNITSVFEEKRITGWNAADDYPHYTELNDLGLYTVCDNYEVLEEAESGLPLDGDKLFGWPYWVQDVEYPQDRQTGTRMELLFQIDSEKNLPYMFGDSGIGYLTQSKDNPGELGFGWACY